MAELDIRPAKSGALPRLDLKWSLMLRVVAVVFFCFLAAATLALFGTYREVRQVNENVADIVVGQMREQLFRIQSSLYAMANFPDWDPVTEVAQGAGQCVRYTRPDGSFGRSSCIGFNRSIANPPA